MSEDKETEVSCSSWEAPDKNFSKAIIQKGYSLNRPLYGSICRFKVINDEDRIISFGEEKPVYKDIVIGQTDSDADFILERCALTMTEEEICDLSFALPLKTTTSCSLHCPQVLLESEKSDKDKSVEPENIDSQNTTEQEKSENSPEKENSKDTEACDNLSASDDKTKLSPSKDLNDFLSPVDNKTLEENVSESVVPKFYKVRVQLESFSREPDIFEMSITEKWRRACLHKEKGVALFLSGQHKWAFRQFSTAVKYLISLEHDIPPEHQPEQGMDIKGLRLSCYLNLAACQLKNNNYENAAKNCSKALDIDPNNSKALYRRGVAYCKLQEYEKAKEDLDRAAQLEPKNTAITKQQQILKAKMQKLNKYYANAMKKMFS